MTEKAILPSDDRTYGMERTSESEDRVKTEVVVVFVYSISFVKPQRRTKINHTLTENHRNLWHWQLYESRIRHNLCY